MADHLQPYHQRDFTTANLVQAYAHLLAMLSCHDIRATFAFVMAFTLSRTERARFQALDPGDNRADPWLQHYWRDLGEGNTDGWHCPEAFDLVRESGRHEIASHGFCHRPLGDGADAAAAELALAAQAASLKSIALKTLVFPRNQVGNLEAVRSAGYAGYRARLQRPGGRRGQALALLEEFAVLRSPQQPLDDRDGLVAIPAGHFFNWRFGPRRLVPSRVTVQRWRHQLRRCASDGGVVHLWLHPHNLVTGPGTAPVLAKVLGEVARLRDKGRISVLTQLDYCQARQAATR